MGSDCSTIGLSVGPDRSTTAHISPARRSTSRNRGRKRGRVDLAKIADGAEVRRIVDDNGSERQIPFAGGGDLTARTHVEAVGVALFSDHHGHIERGLAASLLWA